MRRLAILIAALAMLAAIPASANAYFAQRVVQTTCAMNSTLGIKTIWTGKVIDGTTRFTTVPCSGYVPDLSKPQLVWNRPQTDLEGAFRSARIWWPACEPTWYATSDQYRDGYHYYNWFFHVCI